MKFKAKSKDNLLTVTVKFSSQEVIKAQELTYFSGKNYRGFLKPHQVKGRTIVYSGPNAMSLRSYLATHPVTQYDFFSMIEQIADATQKLQSAFFLVPQIVWDLDQVYINELTKELQFIFLPIDVEPNGTIVLDFIVSIINAVQPAAGQSSGYIPQFYQFLVTQKVFNPAKMEAYIERIDKNIVTSIKRRSVSSSGFMTDKPLDYQNHYYPGSGSGAAQEASKSTGYIGAAGGFTAASAYSAAPSYESTPTYQSTPSYSNTPTVSTGAAQNYYGDEATGLLEEATGLLEEEGEETTLLSEESEETTLLVDNTPVVHYPTLTRVGTGETISIDKPVFRIGKERSYVDFFIGGNSAVSRSHCDIISRGDRYYVKDLNSKNRTFINGVAVPPQTEMEISSGSELKLANEPFLFNL